MLCRLHVSLRYDFADPDSTFYNWGICQHILIFVDVNYGSLTNKFSQLLRQRKREMLFRDPGVWRWFIGLPLRVHTYMATVLYSIETVVPHRDCRALTMQFPSRSFICIPYMINQFVVSFNKSDIEVKNLRFEIWPWFCILPDDLLMDWLMQVLVFFWKIGLIGLDLGPWTRARISYQFIEHRLVTISSPFDHKLEQSSSGWGFSWPSESPGHTLILVQKLLVSRSSTIKTRVRPSSMLAESLCAEACPCQLHSQP